KRLTKTGTMTKHASEDDLHGSDNTTCKLNKNTEFKIGGEFVKILHDNSFNGTDGGDVIDHISKVLEILEWIKILNVDKKQLWLHDEIRRILGFGIRRIEYLYRPCCNKIDELVMVYSGKRRVLNSYGHSDASSTYFCSRTQIGESSRAKYQGSSSF
ncbi:hypothetical protein Tco_0996512, partial [Tanacetum coccineum]